MTQIKLHFVFIICALCSACSSMSLLSTAPHEKGYLVKKTPSEDEYGLILGQSDKPLVLVFTSDIRASLTGSYTAIPQIQHDAGYTVAAIDNTCHGKDVGPNEVEGLGCWASRIRGGGRIQTFFPLW